MPALFRVVPIAEEHFDGFRECVDEVARERLYLAMLEAPPMRIDGKYYDSYLMALVFE